MPIARFQKQSLHRDAAERSEIDKVRVLDPVAEAAARRNERVGQMKRADVDAQVRCAHATRVPSKTGPSMHPRTNRVPLSVTGTTQL